MEGPLTAVEEKVDAGALLIPILRPAQLRRWLAGWLAAGDPGAIKTASDGLKSAWRFGEWHAGAFPKPPYPCSQRALHLN